MIKNIISILFLLTVSLNCFASYNSNPTRMVVHARYVHGATTNTLSSMTIGYVDFGALYLTGSAPASYTGFTVPQSGTYSFQFGGNRCGAGDGSSETIVTRGVSVIYDQVRVATNNDCGIFNIDPFVITGLLAGDVVTFKINENNGGTLITSITDNTPQLQGNFTVWYIQTYP